MTFSHHLQSDQAEHPFAETIRILGKGKKGSRSLTQHEAYRAMLMILADEVLPEQLGAFLMLMRVKEETPEEIAGFVLAAQEACQLINDNDLVDLDWSTYAGKRRHLPWFLLSALLLAENGISVFMHGAEGPSSNRLYTENVLPYFGIPPANSVDEAKKQLKNNYFSYLPLDKLCPKLQDIIELRPILGLRSPVHTLVRMINPFNAAYSIQGIFHPTYRGVHQQASALLNQAHVAVLKGEGGETERNPDMDCLVQSVHEGELSEETWPALFAQRHVRAESLNPELLKAVWQGKQTDEFGEASIIGTAAVALKLLGKADNQSQAHELAAAFWNGRDVERFG
jgi:anthranilate phosphoribosyltransferase